MASDVPYIAMIMRWSFIKSSTLLVQFKRGINTT